MNKKASNVLRTRQNFWGYLFVSPSLILLVVFTILPIFISIFLSFTKFSGFKDPTIIGINNYIKILGDPKFIKSMKNTVIYVLITVPCQTIIAMILAALIAEKFQSKFGETIRGILFIPVLSSSAVAGSIFSYLFASQSDSTMNELVALFGVDKVNWLGDPTLAMLVICFVGIWKNVGYFSVIFYAAIMDVPKTLHEAARVDGATPLQRFFNITLPGIRPVTILVVTLSIIWAFQVMDITMVMTNGGPGYSTLSPVLYIYNEAFKNHKMGYAAAMALILAICIFVVTVVQKIVVKEDD